MKEDIWLLRMKKKYAMLHLKKGKDWVEKKGLKIGNKLRNKHTKMDGERSMKLDSTITSTSQMSILATRQVHHTPNVESDW